MPVQASSLLETLKDVQLIARQQHGSVEIFHLRWPCENGLAYVTLDEALEALWIEVTEFTEEGQVPCIKIINRSEHMVFVMAGEQLVGCKQNRVVNASMLVPPHCEMPLPVTCVEQGRWGYRSPVFSSARNSSPHTLRAMMAGQSSKSYRRSGVPGADQLAVWREVSRKLATTGSSSASDALEDMYRNYQGKLEETVEKLPAHAECNGAVFVIGGRIAGADLFDKPDTLRKLWPKLIKSCAIDVLEPSTQSPESTAQEEISDWLHAAASATLESFPSPGVGRDLRFEGEDVIGGSLVVDDHPVHMELFRRTRQRRAQASDETAAESGRAPARGDTPAEPPQTRASGETSAEPHQPARTEGAPAGAGGKPRSWLRRIFS